MHSVDELVLSTMNSCLFAPLLLEEASRTCVSVKSSSPSSFSRGTSNSCGAFLTSHCARLAERTYNVWTNRLDNIFESWWNQPASKSPPSLDILVCELDLRAGSAAQSLRTFCGPPCCSASRGGGPGSHGAHWRPALTVSGARPVSCGCWRWQYSFQSPPTPSAPCGPTRCRLCVLHVSVRAVTGPEPVFCPHFLLHGQEGAWLT